MTHASARLVLSADGERLGSFAASFCELSLDSERRLPNGGVRRHALDLGESQPPNSPFDAVSLLNVLDRCRRPRTLLQNCLTALEPGGVFIVALALPYRPFYFAGPTTPEPLER